MTQKSLPIGILILAVLQALQALYVLITGAAYLLIPILGLFIAIPFAIIGLFGLFIAYGLFTMQGYAWTWAVILNIIGAALSRTGLNWFGVILSAAIVVYLNLPDIKDRFRSRT
jgi:hypothetical protein